MAVYDPVIRRYSPITQRIVNRLPMHDKIRRHRDSTGQLLVNHLLGYEMDKFWKERNSAIQNSYLTTAELDVTDRVYRIQAEPSKSYAVPETTTNLLRNSSFEVWTNQLGEPDWWEVTVVGSNSEWSMKESTGVIGDRYVNLNVTSGTSDAIITNYINNPNTPRYYKLADSFIADNQYPFKAGRPITFSVYCKLDADVVSSGSVSLYLQPVGRVSSVAAITTNLSVAYGSGAWTRYTYTTTPSEDWVSLNVGIKVAAAVSAELNLGIDAVQVEYGSTATDWEPYLRDRAYHMDYLNQKESPPIRSEYGNRAQYVTNKRSMWRGIPTRLALRESKAVTGATAGRAGFGTEVDFWKTDYLTEWSIDGAYIYKKGIPEEVEDQYGVYKLALPAWNGTFMTETTAGYNGDFTVTPQVVTYFQQLLWVIGTAKNHLATGTAGDSGHYLFIIDPNTWWAPGEPTYLETKAVLALSELSGTMLKVDFRWQDGSKIYITDSTTEYVYDLYRDYFMFDDENKRVYFKELYGSAKVEPTAKSIKRIAELKRIP